MSKLFYLADQKSDFQQLGIKPNIVEIKEDGGHIKNIKNEYEWWYFDTKLKNGGTLVIVFHSRSFVSKKPIIQFSYTPPKGKTFEKVLRFSTNDCHVDLAVCNVVIKKNYFSGNLNNYTIHIDQDGIEAHIQLHSLTTPWRPQTGYLYFGQTNYFAWVPVVPFGEVKGYFKINKRSYDAEGLGYHDHNWGNESFMKLFDHWYWGRAHIENYDVISSHLVSDQKFGKEGIDYFMIQKDGKIITKDNPKLTNFVIKQEGFDSNTKKKYAKQLIYTYACDNTKIEVEYLVDKIIDRTKFIDKLPIFKMNDELRKKNIEFIKKINASLGLHSFHGFKFIDKLRIANREFVSNVLNFKAAYLRFNGVCHLRIYQDGVLTKKISAPATWELMSLKG